MKITPDPRRGILLPLLLATGLGPVAQADAAAQAQTSATLTQAVWMSDAPVEPQPVTLQTLAQSQPVSTTRRPDSPPRRAAQQPGLYSVATFGALCIALAGIGLYRRGRS